MQMYQHQAQFPQLAQHLMPPEDYVFVPGTSCSFPTFSTETMLTLATVGPSKQQQGQESRKELRTAWGSKSGAATALRHQHSRLANTVHSASAAEASWLPGSGLAQLQLVPSGWHQQQQQQQHVKHVQAMMMPASSYNPAVAAAAAAAVAAGGFKFQYRPGAFGGIFSPAPFVGAGPAVDMPAVCQQSDVGDISNHGGTLASCLRRQAASGSPPWASQKLYKDTDMLSSRSRRCYVDQQSSNDSMLQQPMDAADAAVFDISGTGNAGKAPPGSAAAVADVTAAAGAIAAVVPSGAEPASQHPVTGSNGTRHSLDNLLGSNLPDAVAGLSRTSIVNDQHLRVPVGGVEQQQGSMAGLRQQAQQQVQGCQDTWELCQLRDSAEAAADERVPSATHIDDDDTEAALHLLFLAQQPSGLTEQQEQLCAGSGGSKQQTQPAANSFSNNLHKGIALASLAATDASANLVSHYSAGDSSAAAGLQDVGDSRRKRSRQPSKRFEEAMEQEKFYCRALEAAVAAGNPHLGSSKGLPAAGSSALPELRKRRKFVVSSKVPVAEAVVQKLQYAASFFPELQVHRAKLEQQDVLQSGHWQLPDMSSSATAAAAVTAAADAQDQSAAIARESITADQLVTVAGCAGDCEVAAHPPAVQVAVAVAVAAAANVQNCDAAGSGTIDAATARVGGRPQVGTADMLASQALPTCALDGPNVALPEQPEQQLCIDDGSCTVDLHGSQVQQPPQQYAGCTALQHGLQQQHKVVTRLRAGRSRQWASSKLHVLNPPRAADGGGAKEPLRRPSGAHRGEQSQGPVAAGSGSSSSSTGRTKNKGGRPKGSGNRTQMAPRAVGGSGQPGFALRSERFTGVYQSKRCKDGWRAQFCYSNKVLNLGTYESEDDAARAWNAAAVYFRGEGTWINPVQPPLPANYQPGVLQGPAAAVAAAAAIKQAQEAAASAQD